MIILHYSFVNEDKCICIYIYIYICIYIKIDGRTLYRTYGQCIALVLVNPSSQ